MNFVRECAERSLRNPAKKGEFPWNFRCSSGPLTKQSKVLHVSSDRRWCKYQYGSGETNMSFHFFHFSFRSKSSSTESLSIEIAGVYLCLKHTGAGIDRWNSKRRWMDCSIELLVLRRSFRCMNARKGFISGEFLYVMLPQFSPMLGGPGLPGSSVRLRVCFVTQSWTWSHKRKLCSSLV